MYYGRNLVVFQRRLKQLLHHTRCPYLERGILGLLVLCANDAENSTTYGSKSSEEA